MPTSGPHRLVHFNIRNLFSLYVQRWDTINGCVNIVK